MFTRIAPVVALVATLSAGTAHGLPIVHTADFIDDASRVLFTSFEAIPNDGTFFTGGLGPYVDDGIRVEQVNGNAGNGIWVGYTPAGIDGSHARYPNGGDTGFTAISLDGGLDFGDVGFLIGSGNGTLTTAYFELWDDGLLVLSGSVAHSVGFHYLGFEGGGFDTIFLRDGAAGRSFHDGTHNALAVDAIEVLVTIDEPLAPLLFASGLLAFVLARRRRPD